MSNGTELAKAYVQIVPSAKGIKGSISNVLNGESESAGNKAGMSIATKIKGVIAAAGIGKALQSAISEGAKLEQSIGGIETLFKDSANTMKKYASEAYRTAGISANDYMEQSTSFAASLLSSLNGNTKKAAESANQAIIDMADNSNKMGTSLESIQNAYQGFAKQNYTMLDNLKLGYGGTKEEMQRLLKDAQKISGVKYDISNLNDVYSAIHVIQNELGITGTTAKEAATTLSGSMSAMKASFTNLLGNMALGEDIKPSLEALADTTYTFLIDNLLPMIGNVIGQVPTIISTVGPMILENGTDMLLELSKGFKDAFPNMIDTLLEMVQQMLDYLTEQGPTIITKGFEILSNLIDGIINAIPKLVEKLPKIIYSITKFISDNLPLILQKGVEILKKLVKGIIDTIPVLVDNIPKIISAIVDGLKELPKKMLSIGSDVVRGLWDGINDMAGWIGKKIKGFGDSVLSGIKNFFGIHSPSRVMSDQVGKYLSMGVAEGITDNLNYVQKAMNDLGNETLGSIDTNYDFNYTQQMSFNNDNSTLTKILNLLYIIANKDEKDISIDLNGRELGRALREMGVVFE